MLTRKIMRASAVVSLVCAAMLTPAGPAFANRDEDGGGVTPSVSGSEGTGYEVQISVTSESAAPGGGGGDGGGSESWSTQATTTVLPVCFYAHPVPGHAVAKHMEDWYKESQGNPEKKKRADYVGARDYPDWKKHGQEDGSWYHTDCKKERAADGETFGWIMYNFFEVNKNPQSVFVPAGQQPPRVPVDGATLARAAWNAIKLPTPTVETNPKVGPQGATLVGMDTWVWATGSTPKTVTATATAGPTTATVTASSAGLQLSAPDGKASCQGFGVVWHSGMPEGSSPCTISFNRSSAHLGGTTPLTVSVAYSVTYTGSDGANGTLPGLTTTSTINLPVAEVQTLTTNHNNPRQN